MWLVLCLIATILSGFIEIIEKKGSKEQPIRYIIWGLLFYNIYNLIVALCYDVSYINKFNLLNCLKIFPFCLFTSIGYYCSVNALANGDVSRVAPIMKSKTILVLVLSVLLLNETISLFQVLLIFIILILNILLTNQKVDKRRKNNAKGILFAVGFLIFNGLGAFLNKVYVMTFSNPIEISFYTGIVEIIFILLVLTFTKKLDYLNIKKFKNIKIVLGIEVLESIIIILYRFSLVTGDLSIITTITSCSIIITVITSTIVFKEKISFKKWLIILALVACIAILSVLSL